jgi:hypothetical protein
MFHTVDSRRLILLPTLVIAIIIAAPAFAQELLVNPGFEEVGDNGIPTGWKQYGGGAPESKLETSEDAHSGERSARLIDTGPEERDQRYAIGLQQDVPVEAGKLYVLSGWVKALARNNDGAFSVQLRFLPSNALVHTEPIPPIGGDWARVSIAGQAPEGATSARIYLYTMHFWTCEMLIDDFSLVEADAAKWGARLPLASHGGQGIEEVRELNLRTPIVTGGQPVATIGIPEGAEAKALGDKLAAAIADKTGATLTVTTDAKSLVGSDQTIIALGNLNTNFVIERLYWNRYLEVDALKPGPGRYVLQTVHEPYNWPTGVNIVVVGASDEEGLAAGVEDFIARVPQGADFALDAPLLFVSGAGLMDEAARDTLLAKPITQDALREFHGAVRQYRDTGDVAYAERAKRILMFCGERFAEHPRYHYTWPEETQSEWIGAMWDVLEEAPVFTDEERLACTNYILNAVYCLPSRVSGWGGIMSNDSIIWNHTTFPLLGIYWMARYFERYYGDVDGKIADYMTRVHHAFAGQVTCWKPQEDSCGYEQIVPRHTIVYTLAENDYTYFENDSVRKHTNYEVGFCDNTGDAAGFGDSGYGHGPYPGNLHYALWYYKDGRYLWWLDRILENGYANPYDPSVRPTVWRELIGATVFPMHPQVYEYTRTRADYGGEVTPPNVPQEQCFDKISFRQNLDKNGEFFLLDGYARGKHLQYDGNSIIKFYADGQDWLIDGDYLVRNTTDHNGVSVIRDGRCDQLIPACASLDDFANLPSATMTRTTMHEYNGVDWTRNIFWLKGEFVLVMDRMVPIEAGHYAFVGNWKTLAEGDQNLSEGRVFSTERVAGEKIGSYGLITVRNPEEGVETAVKFSVVGAQLDTGVDLPAGEYELSIFASGLNGGTDSFYVSVDGGERTAFHIPTGKIGPSSGTWDGEAPTPNIEITGDAPHRLTITLREGPGALLDRMVFRNQAGEEALVMEGEDPPPLPEGLDENIPRQRFYVKGDGWSANKLTGRINHVGRYITYLRQRFGGQMGAREAAASFNLFYNDSTDDAKDYDLERISDEACVILRDGEPWLVATIGDEARMGGNVEADMIVFGTDRVWGAGVSDAQGQMKCSEPVAVEFTWDPPKVTVIAPSDETSMTVAGMPVVFQNRRMEMDLGGFIEMADAIWELEDTFRSYVERATPVLVEEGEGVADEGLARRLAADIPADDAMPRAPILKLYPTDLDGDGNEELIVLRGRSAHCLNAAGETLWSYTTDSIARSVCAGDLDGDGVPEVLVGSDDEYVYVLDNAGNELRRHHCDAPLRVGTSSVRYPRVGTLAVGDLEGDGKPDIIVGLLNGNLLRYDTEFNALWRVNTIEHGSGELELRDLDGDGILEVLAANNYGAVEIFDADGKQLPGPYSELGSVQMAVGDMNGDGTPEIANGSSTGALSVMTFRGDYAFKFPNYGFGVRQALMANVVGDDGDELIIGSETGYVYVLGADGAVVSQRNFGDTVNDVATVTLADAPVIAVACDDGVVYLMGGDAELSGRFGLGESVRLVASLRTAGGEALVAATAGTVSLLGRQ